MRRLVFVLVSVVLAVNAEAFCFDSAGLYYGVSPMLLRAIARVESSMDPDAKRLNSNGTYDVGLMQVNSSWRTLLGEGFWELAVSSPCGNVYAGAYILRLCIDRYGYSWEAVGCYHSPDPARASAYVLRVMKALKVKER